jgi:hypothetical protein
MRVFISFLSFCLATPCFATVTPNLSLKDLVAQSDEIVTGYVVRSWPAWGTERKFIWTKYEISVQEILKGPHASSVVVSEPGGELDGKASHVAGSVPYQAGEHVTLFLHTFPSGVRRTVGWAQGKFQIDRSGRVQAAGHAMELTATAGARSLDRISYDSFRVTILNLMEKARN